MTHSRALAWLLSASVSLCGCHAAFHPPRLAQDAWGRQIETREGVRTRAYLEDGRAVVEMEPRWSWEATVVQDWIWEHEVAHHTLGHVAVPLRELQGEREADCVALRMVSATAMDVLAIVDVVRDWPGGEHHDDGTERAARLMDCWRGR